MRIVTAPSHEGPTIPMRAGQPAREWAPIARGGSCRSRTENGPFSGICCSRRWAWRLDVRPEYTHTRRPKKNRRSRGYEQG